MIFDTIATSINPDTYHKFFFFLGTKQGILFERSIELVIYSILLYMVFSEYLRTKTKEMKYFIFAFACFLLLKLFSVVINFNVIFGSLNYDQFDLLIPVGIHFFETLAIILLVNAFIYPILKQKIKNLDRFFIYQIICLVALSIIVQIFWMMDIAEDANAGFESNPANMMFVLLRIVIVVVALFLILYYRKIRFRYRVNVFLAFLLYLTGQSIDIFNIIMYGGTNVKLMLIGIPFPLLSMLFFTRIVYHKLSDKAYLKERLEESEKKYKAEKEISKMKDEFVSVVSHELRTPITSMKLYCGLIHSEKFGRMTEKQHQAIHVMESELDRLNNLINDILNLSKLESGKSKINWAEFEVSDIRDIMIENSAKEKGIKIKVNIPKGLKVVCDKEKIMQVYVNLLSNAIKFTEKGGKIDVNISDKGENWEISVADTGRGIPEDEIPKLFDKFYQVESHMTRSVGGSGLGLAIVKSIVDLHKGIIQVSSMPGRGSTFTITLPRDIRDNR